jgi:DNA-directed RNA polymerase II subunit RPB1
LDGYISGDGTITKNSLQVGSASSELIDGINMLCSRLGIFGKVTKTQIKSNNLGTEDIAPTYMLAIRGQWAKLFAEKISLTEEAKNQKLKDMHCSETHCNFKEQHDVVLDEIVEINPIDVKKYPKVYDLTIPSTLNFGLANGLHVVDTAESGYIQRKLVKSLEDALIKYDGTVRMANNSITQFIYGDSGSDTTKQYLYTMKIIEMGDKEIANKYKLKDGDLKKYNWSAKDNEDYFNMICNFRDLLRSTQIKTRMNYITLGSDFMLPVNLQSIIDNSKNNQELKKSVDNKEKDFDAKYILDKIEETMSNRYTKLCCLRERDIDDKKSIKYQNERIAKTSLRVGLHEILAPARCFYEYDLNKTQFDSIIKQIRESYNRNMAEAGEMVGVIAAQAMGEPVTQLNLNAFHASGIKALSNVTMGVPRIKELLSLSKNIKTPQMVIYMTKEFMESREMANKVASNLKHTTLGQIRKAINVYFDSNPTMKDSFMDKDHVQNIYYTHNPNKNSCQTDINSLPWLIRIELDRERMLEKEITLLDIKSMFCNSWEKRYLDMKNMKKEERRIYEQITQLSVLSNSDNDITPVLHIRFDMADFDLQVVNDFIDYVLDNFKLKGIPAIYDVGYPLTEERVLTFDNDDHAITKSKQFVIYTGGSDLYGIRYLHGIDLYKTMCNDVVAMYETFGIEAARASLIREITYAFERASSRVNYHHLSVLVDMMTYGGYLTSIDRHGMNKSDTDPLSRASFEKTVEQLLTASVFGEVDRMKGVSSRVMTGLVIKGGTGLPSIILNTDMMERSEFTEDIGQKYEKTYVPIVENNINEHFTKEQEGNMFIPE